MKHFSRVLVLLFTVHCLLSTVSSPIHAQTQNWEDIQPTLGTDVKCVVGDVATLQGFGCLFVNILSIALQAIGLVMFIMLIIGGFKFLTAGGDPKAVESAKGTLTMAITGLVLAILAWFILSFIGQFTGVNVTSFNLTFP
jgi:hypothetical protein